MKPEERKLYGSKIVISIKNVKRKVWSMSVQQIILVGS